MNANSDSGNRRPSPRRLRSKTSRPGQSEYWEKIGRMEKDTDAFDWIWWLVTGGLLGIFMYILHVIAKLLGYQV